MPIKKKLFLIVSLLYILYTVVPFMRDLISIPGWVISLLSFGLLLILYPEAFFNKVVMWFSLYILVLFLYLTFNKPLTIGIGTVADSRKLIIEAAFILPSISIFSVLAYLKDARLYKIISITTLIFIALSFLYLIPLILTGNTSLRDAMSLEMYQNIRTPGIPTYTLMHAYIILVSAVFFGIKVARSKQKIMLLIVFGFLIFIIINTYITTSLVVTVAVITFGLLYDNKNRIKSIIRISIIALVFLMIFPTGIFLQLMDFLVDFFEGTAAESKMVDFRNILIAGDMSDAQNLTGRAGLHIISLRAFVDNVLFGSYPVGGHSNLLDRLGGLGLFGFIPFIMIIISQLKLNLQLIKGSEERMFYLLGFGSAFVLLLTKGLFGQEGWLFMMVLMPGLIINFSNVKKQVEQKTYK